MNHKVSTRQKSFQWYGTEAVEKTSTLREPPLRDDGPHRVAGEMARELSPTNRGLMATMVPKVNSKEPGTTLPSKRAEHACTMQKRRELRSMALRIDNKPHES